MNRRLLKELEKKEEELKKLRERVLSLNLELIEREKLASLAKMASGVVHEIKTPLSVILTSLYILKKKLGVKGDMEEIRVVEKEVARINEISESLMKLARSSREVSLYWMDSLKVLDEVIEELTRSGYLGEVQLEKKFPSYFPRIFGNENSLREIFLNLLLNGIEAMEGKGKIEIEGKLKDGKALFLIKDTGKGISPEDLPHIFEPFFTRKKKGTGLGLAVTYALVKGMKGDIRVKSKEGEGTVFELEFPAQL